MSNAPPLAQRLDDLPIAFNCAVDLLERNDTGRLRDKVAVIDAQGAVTYAELLSHARRFAQLLRDHGLQREQRIVLCLADTIDFPIAFLGAIWAGMIPVPVNTMLGPTDYRWMLDDCRARAAVIAGTFADKWTAIVKDSPDVQFFSSSGGPWPPMDAVGAALATPAPAPTHRDEPAFWLYSSGSTGEPKGVIHSHGSMRLTADLYARAFVGYAEHDTVLSVAKLFFAYGLGNSLTFPFSVGATVVLNGERPTPANVCALAARHHVTVLNGVPTFYAALLAEMEKDAGLRLPSLRLATSAGESLPALVGQAFREKTGIDVLDGLGSTEMLHIFLSQSPGDVRYGVTGRPVPGYECKIVDENNQEVGPGVVGDLLVKGPTAAMCYWNNRPKSLATFAGSWTRTGDKYSRSEDGWFKFHGRSDDMLKVGGIYVSPIEIEEALRRHAAVRDVAVVGAPDAAGLDKPKAYIVLNEGWTGNAELDSALKTHVRDMLAPYKYPRWIDFVDDLPKTTTGKVQRFRLRTNT